MAVDAQLVVFRLAEVQDGASGPVWCSHAEHPTPVDSTLFHSLPIEARDDYLRSVHRAAAPGASYYILVFATGAFPAGADFGPHVVTEDELRQAVSKYWDIDEIRPAYIHANMPSMPGMPEPPITFDVDEKGRQKMPAFLLTAHKASSAPARTSSNRPR